jgi:hypothetical protein
MDAPGILSIRRPPSPGLFWVHFRRLNCPAKDLFFFLQPPKNSSLISQRGRQRLACPDSRAPKRRGRSGQLTRPNWFARRADRDKENGLVSLWERRKRKKRKRSDLRFSHFDLVLFASNFVPFYVISFSFVIGNAADSGGVGSSPVECLSP